MATQIVKMGSRSQPVAAVTPAATSFKTSYYFKSFNLNAGNNVVTLVGGFGLFDTSHFQDIHTDLMDWTSVPPNGKFIAPGTYLITLSLFNEGGLVDSNDARITFEIRTSDNLSHDSRFYQTMDITSFNTTTRTDPESNAYYVNTVGLNAAELTKIVTVGAGGFFQFLVLSTLSADLLGVSAFLTILQLS